MKLTSKGRYAVMAMADLAKNCDNKPTSLAEISIRQGISLSFLEQLFLRLKKNNLVLSSRGAYGGYLLSKAPEEIKLSSIIHAVDEKIKTVKCKKDSNPILPRPRTIFKFGRHSISLARCFAQLFRS